MAWWLPGQDKPNGDVASPNSGASVGAKKKSGEQWVYREVKDFTLALYTILK